MIDTQPAFRFALCADSGSGVDAIRRALCRPRHSVCCPDVFSLAVASDDPEPDAVVSDSGESVATRPVSAAAAATLQIVADLGFSLHYTADTPPLGIALRWIFDRAPRGEKAIGVVVRYGAYVRNEFQTCFGELLDEGDFGIVHLVRNPVRAIMANHDGYWLSPDEFYADIENRLVTRRKIRDAGRRGGDYLEIRYSDLLCDPISLSNRLVRFLELDSSVRLRFDRRPQRMRPPKTIINWREIVQKAPPHIAKLISAEDYGEEAYQ